MPASVTGLPIAVILALAYQTGPEPLQPQSEPSFLRLSAMIADGSLPIAQSSQTPSQELAQWFNFNQWNNCISGTWRNC